MKKPLIGILIFAYGLSSPLFAAETANLTLSGRVVSETCNTDIVNKQPLQRCGKKYLSHCLEKYSESRAWCGHSYSEFIQ
ncbi:DUF2574 family protein [Klebsiella quasipneumoniae]|uniref:DUF2574 family protein n=1 Tax=Klebsiella quasipneumoniae TaxID=1463165 RepID=UPI001111E503|nr:DUF2574 family protein [Klebsiella quasipneumoniae]HBR1379785.1 DUF2574 family protein [Klebsiella quasipneumoniae subsp. similipneumoniae]MCV6935969.1 YehE family protein [Klebsiella quasipneumoniae]HCB0569110.1 DUF2574 family protein [Klebsiella quasipneumoniae subsp. similipneumoniae]HCI5972928.1 DUF2574 family protein [Klebsiella quasipneumoniae subsp. similipneumoniae]